MKRQATRYTPGASFGTDSSTVWSLAAECRGAPAVMRCPEHVYTRIAPKDTSTFSLNVNESCDGDCAATPSLGGSALIKVAWAHAGAAVAIRKRVANAGRTQSRARRPALMCGSQYDPRGPEFGCKASPPRLVVACARFSVEACSAALRSESAPSPPRRSSFSAWSRPL